MSNVLARPSKINTSIRRGARQAVKKASASKAQFENASFAGVPFRIDPYSARWTFSVKASDTPTVGGKVVQVFGVNLGDMTVSGFFGIGGWRAQQSFLERMKMIADQQTEAMRSKRGRERPYRFLFPKKNWDFLVYLKAYTNPSAPRAVLLTNDEFSPKWSLTFHIVEDNGGLREIVKDAYIARLAKGVGWKQTTWNGPMGLAEVEETLGGQGVRAWLSEQYQGGGREG